MIVATRKAKLAVLALAALPAACSEPPPTKLYLPTADDLPYRFNQDCGCVRAAQCAILEEVAGASEVRNLQCRWERPNKVASCRFEERFNALESGGDGNIVTRPGRWERKELRAVLLPDGRWCSE